MRARVRAGMGIGDRDIQALRHILAADSSGEVLRQKDLARMLSITGASASALVDRLCDGGYAQRIAHPEDRRSVAVVPTSRGNQRIRAALERMEERMLQAVNLLSPQERATVVRFLEGINASLD